MVQNLAEAVCISDILAKLRGAGAQIPATPGDTASLLRVAQQIADNDELWNNAPRMIDGTTPVRLRTTLRQLLAA